MCERSRNKKTFFPNGILHAFDSYEKKKHRLEYRLDRSHVIQLIFIFYATPSERDRSGRILTFSLPILCETFWRRIVRISFGTIKNMPNWSNFHPKFPNSCLNRTVGRRVNISKATAGATSDRRKGYDIIDRAMSLVVWVCVEASTHNVGLCVRIVWLTSISVRFNDYDIEQTQKYLK